MSAPISADLIAAAPKVLLHDHLDGGLRPRTVVDLASEFGYTVWQATPRIGHGSRYLTSNRNFPHYLSRPIPL